ncbi:hypothetical protein ScPMuIL_005254 [Solemya velum]
MVEVGYDIGLGRLTHIRLKMLSIFPELLRQYRETTNKDPRTKDWFLLQDNPFPVWILTALYLGFVYVGPKVMKDRKPFDLRWLMVIYNLSLVGLSVYMFLEILLGVLDANYDLLCAKFDKESWADPKERRIANVLWWYFISKAIELNDTVLMILRKKFNQVTFLHWFHHATMLNIWWWVMMFIGGGQCWFGSCLNCLVHVAMYSYYGLSAIPALKGKLWWKKYITRFQLIQFCCTLSHTLSGFYRGCGYPMWGQHLLAWYMVLMLILFANFYIHEYIKRKNERSLKHNKENGVDHSLNGYVNGTIEKKAKLH